jgi:hypothetical protein
VDERAVVREPDPARRADQRPLAERQPQREADRIEAEDREQDEERRDEEQRPAGTPEAAAERGEPGRPREADCRAQVLAGLADRAQLRPVLERIAFAAFFSAACALSLPSAYFCSSDAIRVSICS